jgi:tyrosyl-tRNA synthetase
MRTADDDVERYLKLFTFLPLESIHTIMSQQQQDASKRAAQHILAKEIVELAHGAAEAKKAENAHKEAFSHGTNTFSLGALRNSLESLKVEQAPTIERLDKKEIELVEYKKAYAASSTLQATSSTGNDTAKLAHEDIVTLPLTMLHEGSFSRVLHAAGLASTKSEAHRLIAKKGAYVVVPNSGTTEAPTALRWAPIEANPTLNPQHFLIDFEALVLRAGKSKIQVCRVVSEETFEAEGQTCVGWEEFKARRDGTNE